MATTIKHLKVGGTTYDIGATTADSVGEANVYWGGKNFLGSFGPMDAALNPVLGANRLAGMAPAGITVEYSTNGGSSWTTYPMTDGQKTALVTTSTYVRIGGPSASQTANSQVRVTLDGVSGGVYTALNKMHIYLSTNYSNGCTVTLESYDYNASTSWHNVLTADVGGWSGWNVLNFSLPGTGCFGGNNNEYHQRKIRLTFKHTGITSGQESMGLRIFRIYGYGGVGWKAPSTLSSNGVPYSYDEQLNVTFPKQVAATKFNGNATGLVDAGNSNTITANYSAPAMAYDNFQYLTVWNGYCLKAVEKTDFVRNNDSGVSTALNKLSVGSSDPEDADYYICQYAGGGTTTTSYHRRPMSALLNYVKSKFANASTSAAGLMSSEDKSKLDGIAANANNYSLPTATSSVLGGVKVGSNITVNSGTISLTKANVTSALGYTPPTSNTTYSIATTSTPGLVKPVSVITKPTINSTTTTSGRYYSVQMSSDGAMFVNVPWSDSNTNYYHTTGSWNGLTYTATANGGAGELKFTIPTGSTSSTVAAGNHTHSQYVTSDSKTSSSNTTSKIYLVGATSQSSAGQTTYSNSSCYTSGGYLYSNGKKVDMDSISGGIEWGTF